MKTAVRRAALVLALLAILVMGRGHSVSAQAKKDKDKAAGTKMGAVFEVYKDRGGKYRFRLKHNGEQVAMSSVGHKTKADVLKIIDTIRREAARAKVEDMAK
jgi:uncharacterized protein YegP (UPF0339 family)